MHPYMMATKRRKSNPFINSNDDLDEIRRVLSDLGFVYTLKLSNSSNSVYITAGYEGCAMRLRVSDHDPLNVRKDIAVSFTYDRIRDGTFERWLANFKLTPNEPEC